MPAKAKTILRHERKIRLITEWEKNKFKFFFCKNILNFFLYLLCKLDNTKNVFRQLTLSCSSIKFKDIINVSATINDCPKSYHRLLTCCAYDYSNLALHTPKNIKWSSKLSNNSNATHACVSVCRNTCLLTIVLSSLLLIELDILWPKYLLITV